MNGTGLLVLLAIVFFTGYFMGRADGKKFHDPNYDDKGDWG